MPLSVHDPVLRHHVPAGIPITGAGVFAAILAAQALALGHSGACVRRDDVMSVDRVDDGVLITMKHDDRRDRVGGRHRRLSATLHGIERRRCVAGRPRRQTRVHAYGGKQVGIGVAEDGRHRAAGR